jgi:hypothetical protein
VLEKGEQRSRLHLEGVVDIGCAGELKAQLMEALGRGLPVQVEMEKAERLDVTAVQLLWAAGSSGVEMEFAGTTPEAVTAELAQAGLREFAAGMGNR